MLPYSIIYLLDSPFSTNMSGRVIDGDARNLDESITSISRRSLRLRPSLSFDASSLASLSHSLSSLAAKPSMTICALLDSALVPGEGVFNVQDLPPPSLSHSDCIDQRFYVSS